MTAFNKSTEEEVQTYTDEELRLWNKGYLAAIEGVLEQMQDDQIRILNRIMETQAADNKTDVNKEKFVRVLEARLSVLDTYSEHYKIRLQQLERDTE